MKKLLTMFEDLWVAVAFAEAGEYESLRTEKKCNPNTGRPYACKLYKNLVHRRLP